MKKTLSIVLCAWLLAASIAPTVRAENATSAATRPLQEIKMQRVQRELERKARVTPAVTRPVTDDKRELFRQRLAEIKETNKQRILETLDQKLAHINKKWTDHFAQVLTHLATIADKLQARGENVDQINAMIDTATTANEAQAAKIYTIDLTDETRLGVAAKAVRDQLFQDLQIVREQIRAIRDALKLVNSKTPTPTI